jgi:hypothetical protein
MTQETTKNIVLILTILSVVVGFFIGVVSDNFFYATVGGIIAHFYQSAKIVELKKEVAEQSVKIQSLSSGS